MGDDGGGGGDCGGGGGGGYSGGGGGCDHSSAFSHSDSGGYSSYLMASNLHSTPSSTSSAYRRPTAAAETLDNKYSDSAYITDIRNDCREIRESINGSGYIAGVICAFMFLTMILVFCMLHYIELIARNTHPNYHG